MKWAKRFLAASVIFTSLAIFSYLVNPRNDIGTDVYGWNDLKILRKDPLMKFRPIGVTFESEMHEIGSYGGIWLGHDLTTYSQSFQLYDEPGRVLKAFRNAAKKAGWSVGAQECLPQRITLKVEKNFDHFFASGWIDAGVWGDSNTESGHLTIDMSTDHQHHRTWPLAQDEHPTCMKDLWQEYLDRNAGSSRTPE